MPSTAKYRRTYFALVRELGIEEEDRHAFQEEHTACPEQGRRGKPSTRDWTADDWRRMVALLQNWTGQHNDPHAHVREDKRKERRDERRDWSRQGTVPRDAPEGSVPRDAHRGLVPVEGTVPADASKGWCSDAQARYIADLVQRIEWRVGPVAYICRTVLAGDDKALRRTRLKAARNEGVWGPELWRTLTSDEADRSIHAFEKASRIYPKQESAHAPR